MREAGAPQRRPAKRGAEHLRRCQTDVTHRTGPAFASRGQVRPPPRLSALRAAALAGLVQSDTAVAITWLAGTWCSSGTGLSARAVANQLCARIGRRLLRLGDQWRSRSLTWLPKRTRTIRVAVRGGRLHRPGDPRVGPCDADVTARATASVGHRTAASRGETHGRTAPSQGVPWHDRFRHSGVVVPATPMPRPH